MPHPFGEILRTPDERFENLPGWTFAPNYIEDLPGYEGMRLHYVDEGPKDAEVTFLCLHGEPSWSYLYRKMAPVFLAARHRVVAPDWFGFGRSDKPVDDDVYTFDFHRGTLTAFFERMALTNVCLVVQDWGGLLGLTIPKDYPQITRMIVMNTGIGVGVSPGEGFNAWKNYVANAPVLKVGEIMKRGTPILSDAEVAAYDAPFPDRHHKAGTRAFPALVPTSESDPAIPANRAAWAALGGYTRPFLTYFGKQDPILGRGDGPLQRHIPGAAGQPHQRVRGSHFLQEDAGAQWAQAVVDWMRG